MHFYATTPLMLCVLIKSNTTFNKQLQVLPVHKSCQNSQLTVIPKFEVQSVEFLRHLFSEG